MNESQVLLKNLVENVKMELYLCFVLIATFFLLYLFTRRLVDSSAVIIGNVSTTLIGTPVSNCPSFQVYNSIQNHLLVLKFYYSFQ